LLHAQAHIFVADQARVVLRPAHQGELAGVSHAGGLLQRQVWRPVRQCRAQWRTGFAAETIVVPLVREIEVHFRTCTRVNTLQYAMENCI